MEKIALVGAGDLSDIAQLVANSLAISVEITNAATDFENYDAIIITDVVNPQKTYDDIKERVEDSRLFSPVLLHISRARS